MLSKYTCPKKSSGSPKGNTGKGKSLTLDSFSE